MTLPPPASPSSNRGGGFLVQPRLGSGSFSEFEPEIVLVREHLDGPLGLRRGKRREWGTHLCPALVIAIVRNKRLDSRNDGEALDGLPQGRNFFLQGVRIRPAPVVVEPPHGACANIRRGRDYTSGPVAQALEQIELRTREQLEVREGVENGLHIGPVARGILQSYYDAGELVLQPLDELQRETDLGNRRNVIEVNPQAVIPDI